MQLVILRLCWRIKYDDLMLEADEEEVIEDDILEISEDKSADG